MTPTAQVPTHPPVPGTAPSGAPHDRRGGRAAVIVNPTSFARPQQLDRLRATVTAEFARQGWRAPLWLATTGHTRGRVEARFALAAGVDVVLVAGGDGTIREVAGELVDIGTPLALLPTGTGNLLARELGVPLRDAVAAVRTACEGHDGALDVGVVSVDGPGGAEQEHLFLVMAGAGFDAEVVAGAGPRLKRRWGHAAYLLSALRVLRRQRGPQTPMTLHVDGQEGWTRPARGVLVGSCGTLTMGLPLLPHADPTDGALDAVALLPRDLREWARAAWSVVVHDSRPQALLPRVRGGSVLLSSEVPLLVQVDGDVVGLARRVRWDVRPSVLVVRRPAPPTPA